MLALIFREFHSSTTRQFEIVGFGKSSAINALTTECIAQHAATQAIARGRTAPGEPELEDPTPVELHTVYGDGSHTTPKKWWAAFCGYGVWLPRWAGRETYEARFSGVAIG